MGAESFAPRPAFDDDVDAAADAMTAAADPPTFDASRLPAWKAQQTAATYAARAAALLDLDGIPAELRALPRWVAWAFTGGDDGKKPGKVPLQADGSFASSTDPSTWGIFADVVAAFRRGIRPAASVVAAQTARAQPVHDVAAGIGFVFDGDGIVGVDLDGCRDPVTGEIASWARDDLAALASWTEVSPTGTGLHVFVRGTLATGRLSKHESREAYDRGRFFTMTGAHVPTTPTVVRDAGASLPGWHASRFPERAAKRPTPTSGSPVVDLYARGGVETKYDADRLRAWGLKRLDGICAALATASDGSKRDRLFTAAMSAKRSVPHGHTLNEARAALLDVVDRWGSRVASRADAEAAIDDGFAKGVDPPAYPVERPRPDVIDDDELERMARMYADGSSDVTEAAQLDPWTAAFNQALADVRAHSVAKGDGAKERGPIPFQSFGDLLASDLPRTAWLVSGLVTDKAVAVVSGEPKTAKTWTALEVACCVATGQRVFGEFKTGDPRPVVLFLVEDSAANTRARLRGILAGHGIVGDAAKAAPLSVRCLDAMNLADDANLARFVASVRMLPTPPALVVLDPLRDLHTGAEDKADDMARITAALRTLRAVLDCAVLFVHHAGKASETQKGRRGGQRMRGSSALHGAIDAGLHLYEPTNAVDDARRTTTMGASVESEVKAGRSAGAFGLSVEIIDSEAAFDGDVGECERATFTFSRQRAAERAREDATERDEDEVFRVLRERAATGDEWMPKSHVKTAVGGNASRANATIERLAKAGALSCKSGARGAVLFAYSEAKETAWRAKHRPLSVLTFTGTEARDADVD
jgi:hypothetical protein